MFHCNRCYQSLGHFGRGLNGDEVPLLTAPAAPDQPQDRSEVAAANPAYVSLNAAILQKFATDAEPAMTDELIADLALEEWESGVRAVADPEAALPGHMRKGIKRKVEARRGPNHEVAGYYGDPEQRVTIWNRVEQRKLSGNSAPFRKNLGDYIRKHPVRAQPQLLHTASRMLAPSMSSHNLNKNAGAHDAVNTFCRRCPTTLR